MNRILVILTIASCYSVLSDAVNILLLEEIASPSHHAWFRSVANALASKGYNVTVVTPDNDDIDVENIHYIRMEKVFDTFYHSGGLTYTNFMELGNANVFTQLKEFATYPILVCLGNLKSDGWKQLDNYPSDFKFDLIIHDYLMGGCLISFANKFKNVPLIAMTAFNDISAFSSYVKCSVVPSLSPYPYYNHNSKTFLERAFNFLLHITDKIILNYYTAPTLTKMIKKLSSFKDTPSTLELARRSVVFLTNYDPSIDGIQQMPSNVIHVGGLQIKAAKSLPEDLQTLADGATNGLILFSLGTNVQSEMLGAKRIGIILETFRKLSRYTFLWKSNLEDLTIPLPKNVIIRKWVPQNDILAHKNTIAFITHGGLMSTQEAIYHGVPMLGIPVFADQFINIHKSVNKGIGDLLYLKDFSIANLYKKLNDLLTQPKYRQKIKLASVTFRDQKEQPLERAIWWIDWVMRNPNGSHFESSGQDLNFLQLESFDVIVFFTVTSLLALYSIVSFLTLCRKFIFRDIKIVAGRKTKIE